MKKSNGFEKVGIGIVAENPPRNSHEISVTPQEIVPTISGELSEDLTYSVNNKNQNNVNSSVKLNKKKFITATWYNNNNFNRATPPNVRRGMTVELYNYQGGDIYYWSTPYYELDLAEREIVTYIFSNKDSSSKDMVNDCYYITFDTVNKQISLHTSDNDGEYTTYDIKIDTKDGIFFIIDGEGNSIVLNTAKKKIKLNSNESIHLNTDKFIVTNEKEELLDLLTETILHIKELTKLNRLETHIGNLARPTRVTVESTNEYLNMENKLQILHDRMATFKADNYIISK